MTFEESNAVRHAARAVAIAQAQAKASARELKGLATSWNASPAELARVFAPAYRAPIAAIHPVRR